jgi:cytochrome c553
MILLTAMATAGGLRAEPTLQDFAETYCLSCHDADSKKGHST